MHPTADTLDFIFPQTCGAAGDARRYLRALRVELSFRSFTRKEKEGSRARFPRPSLRTFAARQSAAAPETISMISRVMLAWRMRFMLSVSVWISSPAFFEAESIAVMRAPCSDATDSRSAR